MKDKIALILLISLSFYAAAAAAQAQEKSGAAAATEQKSAAGPKTSECVPECRQGFTCAEGKCVSGCNPPCPAGEVCTELGRCVPASGGGQPAEGVHLMVPLQPQPHPELGPGNPGWAMAAGIVGVVGAAAITGLTAGSVVKHGKSASAYLGIGALSTLAIFDPIVAVGAMSARDNPVNQGLPTVRILSWIGYGVTLASGMGLLVYGVDHKDVAPGFIAVVGMLGVLSTVGFTVDAFVSAHQATSPVGGDAFARLQEPSLKPLFVLAPGPDGSLSAALGLSGRF